MYRVRPSVRSVADFKALMSSRLSTHIVARSLAKLTSDFIDHEDVRLALIERFKGYGFSEHTWALYASYFIAWLRYSGVDFGRRLTDVSRRRGSAEGFIPNWRPDKDLEVFAALATSTDEIARPKGVDKALYDLKSLGLLRYEGPAVFLTKRGLTVKKLDQTGMRKEIAVLATEMPKIAAAVEALKASNASENTRFEDALAPILSAIRSDSYRHVATGLLKAWARFVINSLPPNDDATITERTSPGRVSRRGRVANLPLPFATEKG